MLRIDSSHRPSTSHDLLEFWYMISCRSGVLLKVCRHWMLSAHLSRFLLSMCLDVFVVFVGADRWMTYDSWRTSTRCETTWRRWRRCRRHWKKLDRSAKASTEKRNCSSGNSPSFRSWMPWYRPRTRTRSSGPLVITSRLPVNSGCTVWIATVCSLQRYIIHTLRIWCELLTQGSTLPGVVFASRGSGILLTAHLPT